MVVGSGLAGLTCALELAGSGWETTVVTAGLAGRDGATHRVHGLAPWILLTAPWVKGDSPDRFLAELKARGQGLERDGLAEIFAAGAHAAARGLMEVLDLEPLDGAPVALPGEDVPRGLRCRPRQRRVMLAPLLARCAAAGVRIRERTVVYGLLLAEGRAAGALAWLRDGAGPVRLAADMVVLACGERVRRLPGFDVAALVPGQRSRRGRNRGCVAAPARTDPGAAGDGDAAALFPDLGRAVSATIWINDRTFARGARPRVDDAGGARAGQRRPPPVSRRSGNGARALLPPRVPRQFDVPSGAPGAVARSPSTTRSAASRSRPGAGPHWPACTPAARRLAESRDGRRTMGTGLLEAAMFGRRAAPRRPSATAAARTRGAAAGGRAAASGRSGRP